MLNYEVPLELLESRVPAQTELDLWDGKAIVSIVGFSFLDTRLKGIPIPYHRDFPEVNLRFYVRRKVAGEWRRGVVFIKEIVPRRAVTFIARWFYNENYFTRPMSSEFHLPMNRPNGHVAYRWYESKTESVSVTANFGGEPQIPGVGSEEEFITEHYWGYARQKNGTTMEYQVQHPQWRVWEVARAELTGSVELAYGKEFAQHFAGEPSSAFVADGSQVDVYAGKRL
ncbi:MAG: hypothetical protein ACI9G1_001073 [Pirellulaceae bacterium]|jgi:uncharacterized protein YqjF (DUF2071 family)